MERLLLVGDDDVSNLSGSLCIDRRHTTNSFSHSHTKLSVFLSHVPADAF